MSTLPPTTSLSAQTPADIPAHLPANLRDCFTQQRAAFAQNRAPSLAERRADLRALHGLLVENRDALVDAVNQDFGCRSRFETLMTELLQGQEAALHAVSQLPRWMKRQKRPLDITQYPLASAFVQAQPLGVVGIVVPWNFPIAMVVQPMIGALAAGNRVMVKMSENSAHLAHLLQSLLPRYFAFDKVSVFADAHAGPGQSLGPLFTQLPFNHLFFTGSPQTGKAVMTNCAAHLTPVTLELGGKSPAIVAPDYSLEKAAERILWVKMLNAGQICTNVDYLFLPEGQEEAFIAHAQRIVAQRYPDLTNGDYTAIIDQRQYDRLQAMLQDAIAQGAQAVPLCPGQAGDAARRIMPPVALLGVHAGMQVMQREIFGPLLPILPYRHKDEVVQYINDRPHPLALYLFSHDRSLQDHYLSQTLSGGVTLNDTLLHAGQHHLPFGGVGASGMGHYHGREGFLTFSKLRPVFQQGPLRTVNFLTPPYAGLASKVLNAMLWRSR
ncbi:MULTISPECIES: coniferyl aldehyde dehydrogenase [unclassified Simplicispira]|uniref:coniferyl aldehyde dehydrogenase n=1 Tax=unclassified Simplicispira TaxID=2630407 RepID=UPI000D5F3A1C|nr:MULTISPECIES: coniferyl aldehyde dehydrogenase [unclassified Simplicispira]PVY56655.1 coniferyl-aldehyde dehydrogenase [Simplicispira sp. 125]REG17599.1 coniferyl-aldehyde dehydrogenase [Simplicispira sp. 110]